MACDLDFTTPEAVFASPLHIPAQLPSDAIHCALARSKAVLHLLMAQFDEPDARCSDHIILDALWDVIGNLENISTMLNTPSRERAN